MSFCKNLKRIRKEKGFETAKDFTERGLKRKIKYTTYVGYEVDRLPGEENIILIASTLKVHVDDLFGFNLQDIDSPKSNLDKALDTLKALPVLAKKDNDNKEVVISINGKVIANIPFDEIIDIVNVSKDRFTRNYITNMNRRLCDAAILNSIIDYATTGKPALKKYRSGAKLKDTSKSTNNKLKKISPRTAKATQKKVKDVMSRIEV